MRLDKWLKVSRIIKRRIVANEAAGAGRVAINGKIAKPASEVKPGDTIDILLGGNPEYLARRAMRQKGYDDAAIDEATGFNEDVSDEIIQARALYKEL